MKRKPDFSAFRSEWEMKTWKSCFTNFVFHEAWLEREREIIGLQSERIVIYW